MNRLKTVDMIYIKRSRYKLHITLGVLIIAIALAFGASFGVYYKQYQQLFRIYTELFTKYTSLSKGPVCENADPYPTYKIITKIPKQIVSQSTVQQLNAISNTASNRYLQRLQAEEEQEFEYFTKILQIKPILKDLVLENLLAGSDNSDSDDTIDNNSNYYQEIFTKYGQISSIEQIDSSKIEPEEIDDILVITSAGSLEYTNFTNYHEQEEQLLKNLEAVGLKPNSKIDIPKDVQLEHQKGCGIPYSPTQQSILIEGNVHLPIHIKGNVATDDKQNTVMNTVYQNNYQGDIVVEGVAGNMLVKESVNGNITVQKGVSGNITVQEGGVGGKIHITGNVGENITTMNNTTIYIEGNVIGHKNGTIQIKGELSSEVGNVIEIGSISAITEDDTQRTNAFVVHNTIEVSDNGIAILNNEKKENAFVFGQRLINLANNQYSSLSKYSTEKNDAYKYIDYKPRGFFVNGSLIGCNNNSSFSGLAIHVRGDLKAPYGAVFNKSFEGASTNGATALSIGGQLKGYWNSLSTKSIILVEEETGVEECLQNEECVQELYLQRIYRVCNNIGTAYNLSITEEECANLHHINTGVVEILGGIRTVAGNGISVNGDIDCKGSNGKGITVSGKVIGNTYGVSLGDVSASNGKGVSIKSITSTDRALYVNGDISSSKEGVYIKGDITANKNVLYVDGNINGMSNQALFVSGDITLNNSFEGTNKVVWIKGGIGTKEPNNIAQGAGIALQVDKDIQCGDSAVIVNGGVKAFGFRGDQPENEPKYGIKVKYIDVSSNSTGVVQGPYGIHVGWINSFNTSINITNEDHTQTITTTDENGEEQEETITLPAIRTNYTAINIGGDIEGYGRHIELTDKQKNDISQPGIYYDSEEYKQKLNEIKQSFEYVLVSIDGDIKADIATSNDVNYTITYSDQSTAVKNETIYHSPKLLLSTKGIYSSMTHSRTDGIQINGDIMAANGITVVGNITTSLTTGGETSFDDQFADKVKAYVKIKGSLYQNDTSKRGPNGIVVGGVIRAKSSHGFYIANSNKKIDGDNTIEAGLCISVDYGNLVASTASSTSSSQHVIQIWSGDIIVVEDEEGEPSGSPSEEPSEGETEIKTHIIPAGTYTSQQLLDKLIEFNSAIGLNINGNVENLRKGIGIRLSGDITAQTNGVYISGTVKTDYQDAKLDKGVSYSAIYAGNIKSNWNGITVGNIEAEKIGIAVKGTVKQTGDYKSERCYYDCLEVDTGNNPNNLNRSNCDSCRNQTNYKNTIDDVPAAISVQSIQSTGIGYGIHVFESIKTKNDSIKVSGLNQIICDSSDKLNTSICSNNANGIIINGTIYAGKTGIDLNGSLNSTINHKIKNRSIIENGIKYEQYYYENITTAIQAETGINIHGMINTTEIGIKLNKDSPYSYSYFLNSTWFDTSADPDYLLNVTTKYIPYAIKGKVGLDIQGLIDVSEIGIQLEGEDSKQVIDRYDEYITYIPEIQYSYNSITSGLTAIQVNGNLNSTGATTVNITGTVYNDYYLPKLQECYKDGKITSTEDDGLTNITAVYIKQINTLENKEYYNDELDIISNLGTCYIKSKGAYGLIVDRIQSLNGSVTLSNNITSIGDQAIRVGEKTYVYGRIGALQVDTCATLRANDSQPLNINFVSFINENSDSTSYSVYLNKIYTNRKSYLNDDISESNYEGICPNDNV